MILPKKLRVILAAGGVVRRSEDDPRIALVYRERLDDWSLPKGKLDGRESFASAAVREVFEETGCRARIREFVGAVDYRARQQRPKVVLYYAMDLVEEGRFESNDEVQGLEWLTVRQAAGRLTYDLDRQVLRRYVEMKF